MNDTATASSTATDDTDVEAWDLVARKDKPKGDYGDVEYADPGYQEDGKPRYPVDTKAHAKSAWSYINKDENRKPYSPDQLNKIEAKIKAACKNFGVDINDDKKSLVGAIRSAQRAAVPERHFHHTRLEIRVSSLDAGDKLPDGVCGRMTGVALTYNVADDYGTVFLPGCLAKTRAEKVASGKVKLFADHGPFTGTHVGVVRSLDDSGDSAVMSADLFDTEAGRAMKEYLAAVIASGADTGLSIGFRPVDKEWRETDDGKDTLCYFKEITLREISITPVPAVPGTNVFSVRREQGETDDEQDMDLLARGLVHILRALPEHDARTIFDRVYKSAGAAASATTDPKASAEAHGDTSSAPEADTSSAASRAETPGPKAPTGSLRLELHWPPRKRGLQDRPRELSPRAITVAAVSGNRTV